MLYLHLWLVLCYLPSHCCYSTMSIPHRGKSSSPLELSRNFFWFKSLIWIILRYKKVPTIFVDQFIFALRGCCYQLLWLHNTVCYAEIDAPLDGMRIGASLEYPDYLMHLTLVHTRCQNQCLLGLFPVYLLTGKTNGQSSFLALSFLCEP